ncbi:MAG: hypothetical protein KDA47_24045 [Planctomycetales bacterium]|nr:hypothetical protein [Planctomycetales bacterium]
MLCCPFRVAVKRKLNCVLLFLIALMLFTRASAVAADAPSAIPVKLEQNGQQWRLTRGGQPFSIRGVGGDGSLDLLSKSGGNSVRTWDVDDKTERLLDEAHRLGITVTLGIWLGHERHGFRYTSFDDVTAQTEKVRAAVERFKNHPAVLMWALGNEMEGYDGGDNPAIWQHVESLAAIVKRLDPHHPVMTVVAEIGGRRVQAIHRFCPSIDIVGINSYAGAATRPRRYREAGGTKPYVVTEYGVPGFWEVPKNELGSVDEPTSTTKAESYRRTYQALSDDQALCLGSFAFIWGHKQEATATWFGMMLPDGKKLAAVDAMTELWSGSPPTNRCPRIERLEIKGSARLKPGATFQASLTASDPESDSIKVRWVLTEDSQQFPTGGDFQAAPIGFPEAIGNADERQATITMPRGGGHYRLYVFVSDSQGGAATANVPLFVDTGIIPTQNFNLYGAEVAGVLGSFWHQSEVIFSHINRTGGGDNFFWGAYSQIGYYLTGEVRPYNHKGGVLTRVTPLDPVGKCHGLGAWEVVGRWSYIDLNDATVAGNELTNLSAGLNWHLNRNLKWQFQYIHGFLDNIAVGQSNANIYAMRVQMDF